MSEWRLSWSPDNAAGAAVLPGGVGTICGSIRGSVAARLEECCCLWASWPRTADGSGWSLSSAGEREVYGRVGLNLNLLLSHQS